MAARSWDDFDALERDASGSDEVTQLTEDAHRWARAVAEAQLPPSASDVWRLAYGGARLRILTPYGYVAEVRGQSSATAHGKQGAHPSQIAQLRELEEPVLMVFKDGGIIQSVWLHDPGPDIVNIDADTAHRRQGWWVKQMKRENADHYRFPESAPAFEPEGLF